MIPAVCYFRMSSDPQVGSIESQRTEVTAWAAPAGYHIIGEYVDSGQSAFEDPSKRHGFQKMLKDVALPENKAKAILCWDVSRFGRSHPMKMAVVKDKLNNLGIHLATKKQGRLDWDTFQGLIVDLLHASGAHEYSKSLSADSVRGRIRAIEEGSYPNGAVPYGYGRLYTDATTGTTYPVSRTTPFKKPRGWKLTLVIHEPEAAIVRWLFRQFLDRDISMRQLAREVAEMEKDNPDTLAWSKDTVRSLLTNKTFAGYAHIGGNHAALRKKEVANRVGAREKAGVVPELVTLSDWEKVQALIATRLDKGWKVRPKLDSPLSGVLICGACGYRLEKKERSDKGGERYRFFQCSSATKRPQLGCKQWRVRESEILPIAVEWLVKVVDEEVLRQQDATRLSDEEAMRQEDEPKTATPLEALKGRLDALTAKIEKGRERYLKAPDALLEGLESMLGDWQREQEGLEKEIRLASVTKETVKDFTGWWETIRGTLVEVLPTTQTPDPEAPQWQVFNPGVHVEPERLRRMLKDFGFTLTIYWRPKGKSVRYYELDKVRIVAELSDPMAGGSANMRQRGVRWSVRFQEVLTVTGVRASVLVPN